MGEVVSFPGSDTLPLLLEEDNQNKEHLLSSEAVLFGAMDNNLKEVIVVGITEDGSLYMGSNTNVIPKVNYLLDIAKSKLINVFTNSAFED